MNNKTVYIILGVLVLLALLFTGRGVSVSVDAPDGGTPVEVSPPDGSAAATEVEDWFFKIVGAVPIVISVGAMGGLVSGAINLLKLVPSATKLDGQSAKIALVLNLAVYGAVALAGAFGYGEKVKQLIEELGLALPSVVTILTMLGASKLVHVLMKKFDPKAFSLTKQKTAMTVG